MSAPADMPRTPPAPPPGLALTQGPFPTPTGLGPPANFDSVRLDPGRFDISGWAGEGSRVPDPARANEDVVPTIIDEARTLVGRYRRASWRAESVADPARRLANRALREIRDALACGLTVDGIRAASSLIAAAVEAGDRPASSWK